ncbi:thiol-disulfide oxidoreductase DCC family protein [Devosia sp.]|uniref:thiol-disulfide oxidoreductase DCC family protein n=1 Tax=Devosia sp. TaxID=1871048 RepID=UPI00261FF4D8|nr:DCC1-like thiol-disulfide oxidoreductase family protein [Devosia sp.]
MIELEPATPGRDLMFAPDMVVVFDTDCVLCSSWVHFILQHERDHTTRFISAWSEQGAALAGRHGLTSADLQLTYLVVEGERGLTQSNAGLAIARHLKMPWRLLAGLVVVPRAIRDAIYRLVARNRYRWFGRKDNCSSRPRGRVIASPTSNAHCRRLQTVGRPDSGRSDCLPAFSLSCPKAAIN